MSCPCGGKLKTLWIDKPAKVIQFHPDGKQVKTVECIECGRYSYSVWDASGKLLKRFN